MNNTVWKFPLGVGLQIVEIPHGAKLLHVDMQEDTLTLWAAVDPNMPLEKRRFVVLGTGWIIAKDCVYVGTGVGKEFVWHVFEDI